MVKQEKIILNWLAEGTDYPDGTMFVTKKELAKIKNSGKFAPIENYLAQAKKTNIKIYEGEVGVYTKNGRSYLVVLLDD